MSAPPDYHVLTALEAAAADIAQDNETNEQLVAAILDGATAETIARVWDSLKGKPPKVIQGQGIGQPPEPPVWVVLLKSETPLEGYAGHLVSEPEPVTIADQLYLALGCPSRQTIQIQCYADNPETVRFHYLFVRSLMFRVAWDLMRAEKAAGVYPVTGGDYLPLKQLAEAGLAVRFTEWAIDYESLGFVPVDTPGTSIEFTETPLED